MINDYSHLLNQLTVKSAQKSKDKDKDNKSSSNIIKSPNLTIVTTLQSNNNEDYNSPRSQKKKDSEVSSLSPLSCIHDKKLKSPLQAHKSPNKQKKKLNKITEFEIFLLKYDLLITISIIIIVLSVVISLILNYYHKPTIIFIEKNNGIIASNVKSSDNVILNEIIIPIKTTLQNSLVQGI